jgi:hypothetical protein
MSQQEDRAAPAAEADQAGYPDYDQDVSEYREMKPQQQQQQ